MFIEKRVEWEQVPLLHVLIIKKIRRGLGHKVLKISTYTDRYPCSHPAKTGQNGRSWKLFFRLCDQQLLRKRAHKHLDADICSNCYSLGQIRRVTDQTCWPIRNQLICPYVFEVYNSVSWYYNSLIIVYLQ